MIEYEDYTSWSDFIAAIVAAGYTRQQMRAACRCDLSVVRRWITMRTGTRLAAIYACRLESMQATEMPGDKPERKKHISADIVPPAMSALIVQELCSMGWTRRTIADAIGFRIDTISRIARGQNGTKAETYRKLLALREVPPPVPAPKRHKQTVPQKPAIYLTEEGESLFRREMLLWAETHPERMEYSREYYKLWSWMARITTCGISTTSYQRLAQVLVSLDMEEEILDIGDGEGLITDPDIVAAVGRQIERLCRMSRFRDEVYRRGKLCRSMMAVKRGDIMTAPAAKNVFALIGDLPESLTTRILSMVTPDRMGVDRRKAMKRAEKHQEKRDKFAAAREAREARKEKKYTFVDIVDEMVIPDVPPRRAGYDFFAGLPYPEEAPWLYRERRAA